MKHLYLQSVTNIPDGGIFALMSDAASIQCYNPLENLETVLICKGAIITNTMMFRASNYWIAADFFSVFHVYGGVDDFDTLLNYSSFFQLAVLFFVPFFNMYDLSLSINSSVLNIVFPLSCPLLSIMSETYLVEKERKQDKK